MVIDYQIENIGSATKSTSRLVDFIA